MTDQMKTMHPKAVEFLKSAPQRSGAYITDAFKVVMTDIMADNGDIDEAVNDALSVCSQLIAMAQITMINLLIMRAGVPTIARARELMEQRVGQMVDNAIAETVLAERRGSGNV